MYGPSRQSGKRQQNTRGIHWDHPRISQGKHELNINLKEQTQLNALKVTGHGETYRGNSRRAQQQEARERICEERGNDE